MNSRRISNMARSVIADCAPEAASPMPARTECLELILCAFFDIADRDDIHQAAERLTWVQRWIENETERAAADPLFADLQPA
jgi:hypothetical protein